MASLTLRICSRRFLLSLHVSVPGTCCWVGAVLGFASGCCGTGGTVDKYFLWGTAWKERERKGRKGRERKGKRNPQPISWHSSRGTCAYAGQSCCGSRHRGVRMLMKLRFCLLSLSRYKLKFSPDKVDTMIIQAICEYIWSLSYERVWFRIVDSFTLFTEKYCRQFPPSVFWRRGAGVQLGTRCAFLVGFCASGNIFRVVQ